LPKAAFASIDVSHPAISEAGGVGQQPMQSPGSTIGGIPNENDNMANAIRIIEAHTPKAMSAEFSRSRVAMGGYKTVGENKAMSISKSLPSNQ
jgi:hypothetical protein